MTDTGYHFDKYTWYEKQGHVKYCQTGCLPVVKTTNAEHRANGAIFILCVGLGSFIGVVIGIIIVSM